MEDGGVRWGWRSRGRREERAKREIVTTELVAGADFFHHLPCEAPGDKPVGGLGESES